MKNSEGRFMLRRILAWILLIGFLLLMINIFVFGFYWQLSIGIYLVVAVYFLFSKSK